MLYPHFCTLFDSAYLPKGLALYESLARHSSLYWKLFILPMDSECRRTLRALDLPQVELIDPLDFEFQMQLADVKANRTHQEWCWSCASQLCEYLMRFTPIDSITYLDADLFFFSDPATVFDEIGERSIAITPHRFQEKDRRRLEPNGLFNVGLVHFKDTPTGRTCLTRWAIQVRNRCSATMGCGDQQYLDQWPADFGDDLCIIQNIGVNVGPWSLGNWPVTKGPCVNGVQLSCYHFHELQEDPDGTFRLTNYQIRQEDVELIYSPYLEAYRAAKARIGALQAV